MEILKRLVVFTIATSLFFLLARAIFTDLSFTGFAKDLSGAVTELAKVRDIGKNGTTTAQNTWLPNAPRPQSQTSFSNSNTGSINGFQGNTPSINNQNQNGGALPPPRKN